MDGNFGLHVTRNAVEHLRGAERESAITPDGAKLLFRSWCLIQDQRPKLRVAALLDNIAVLMSLDKACDLIRERKAAYRAYSRPEYRSCREGQELRGLPDRNLPW